MAVPRLALYATFGDDHWTPYNRRDARLRAAVRAFMHDVMRPWQVRCIEAFCASPGSVRAVEVENAHHYLFFSHEDIVVKEILSFTSPSGS